VEERRKPREEPGHPRRGKEKKKPREKTGARKEKKHARTGVMICEFVT
jgi:hypothetical protein